jgi:hypothetical protein
MGCVKGSLTGVAALCIGLASAFAGEYAVTVLPRYGEAILSRLESRPTAELVGKSVTTIYGPIAEVRVHFRGVNQTELDQDAGKVAQRVRERIDRARCIGRESEIPWHQAPWLSGHLILDDGGILPIEILLSGILVGDLLFVEEPEPDRPLPTPSPCP